MQNQCFYICADDAHGTPIMLKAKELQMTPEELISKTQKEHMELAEQCREVFRVVFPDVAEALNWSDTPKE